MRTERIENVLEGMARYPEVEMAYINYGYTHFDDSDALDASEILAAAAPIGPGGPNRLVDRVSDVAGLNENLFTAIYACAFRRDHALRAYQLDTRGDPFTSLATCVPSSVYTLSALHDRPAWWVGDPAVVVNMKTSWQQWALLWRLERMPDLYEEAEHRGVDPARLDLYRLSHLRRAPEWVRAVYFDAEDNDSRELLPCASARAFQALAAVPRGTAPRRARGVPGGWEAGRVIADDTPPQELFVRYGL